MHRIGTLHDDDARVFAELVLEDAVAGIDGIDLGGIALEEAVDEAAGVGAEVGADQAGDVDAEGG